MTEKIQSKLNLLLIFLFAGFAAKGEEIFLSHDDTSEHVFSEESIAKEAPLTFSRVICRAGEYYDDLISRIECQLCPDGTWSAKDETKCHECPPGQYAAERLSCKNCPVGTYSGKRQNSCSPCGAGEVSAMKGTICTKCPIGKYADKVVNKCKPCPKGTFSQESSCTTCPAGSYSGTGETQCHACIPGQYFDPKLRICVDCRSSYFSSSPLSACQKCAPGTYSGPKEASCHYCPAGTTVNTAQTKCRGTSPTSSARPTFSPPRRPGCSNGEEYNTEVKGCQKCFPGYFSSNGIKCLPCSPGYFAVAPGMLYCILCPAGKVVNTARTRCTDASTSTPTPSPTDIPTYAPTPSPTSELCPAEVPLDYEVEVKPWTACKPEIGMGLCPYGQAFNPKLDKCVECLAGYYSSNLLHRLCRKCSPKRWSPPGSTWCQLCPKWQRPNEDQSGCEATPF